MHGAAAEFGANAAAKEKYLPLLTGTVQQAYKMTTSFNTAIPAINNHFLKTLWLDFEIIGVHDGVLKLKASTDFCYYHECEIELYELRYFSGPMEWTSTPADQLIEILPDNEAVDLINRHKLETPCSVITFNTDDAFKVIIAAGSIRFNFDTVYYYERENLAANERVDKRVRTNR